MFKVILIPIDFSQKVTNFISLINKLSPQKIILLNIIDNLELSLYKELYMAMTSSALEEGKDSFKHTPIYKKNLNKLMEYKKSLYNKNYHVEGIIEQGIPFKKIIALSKKHKVGLILIPAYGKRLSLIKDVFMMGGTVTRVVRCSKIPVLVVK